MSKDKMKLKKYDVALATRNFEIELFWKRSVFFWGFIASAFVGYATVAKDSPVLAFALACFGFVCSIAWSLVNRGSKYWQENWESIVANIEDEITGELFKYRARQQKKGTWLTSRQFSVSKVTIALSDFTCLIWFAFMLYHLIKQVQLPLCLQGSLFVVSFFFLTIIFVIFMVVFGRSSDA
ncbi:hypothetical protein [Vibrio aestuarianus]|uniref:RipA family octameric membrane protein n=1 Tax=Vibrio aestuarianus TaxID=28171 RepID=UPI00237C80AC|nr:hypothetical protein [Vibrio aestuarianus]MDE1330439.1 hypothetical protein [Vibrio aestuarianus]